MLSVHQVYKSYGIFQILENISFNINAGDRIGLIGPNGSGKTTLLRILAGSELPDSGTVTHSLQDLKVGYLSQGFEREPDSTIRKVLEEASGDPDHLSIKLRQLASEIAQFPEDISIQIAYDHTLQELNQPRSGQMSLICTELGLTEIPQEQLLSELSGGQKTRLSLALLLFEDPQLLLLDEPTNHLDIDMLEWLEYWLEAFNGAALIVSHDRTFLDQTVHRILDLDPLDHSISSYEGTYSEYIEKYRSLKQVEMAAYKDQEAEIRKVREDIARTKSQAKWVETTTTPRQPGVRRIAKKVAAKAKAREKKLERFLSSDNKLEKPVMGWQLKLDFDGAPRIGQDVLYFQELSIGYDADHPLLTVDNISVQSGQRIAVTGENGSGKTTLFRTIAALMEPLGGRLRIGASVRIGYMAQEQEHLDRRRTPLESIQSIAPMNQTDARSFLHFFLFEQDDAVKAVGDMSYGERARLELAVLVASGSNLLLLDEPINHLDIPSRERFELALSTFPGTVMAVVHDRYFIERYATDLWLVSTGRIETRIVKDMIS